MPSTSAEQRAGESLRRHLDLVRRRRRRRSKQPTGEERTQDSNLSDSGDRILRLVDELPPELWNRFGTKVLPKLRSGKEVRAQVELSASLPAESAGYVESDLRQILEDLGLTDNLRIE